MGAAGFKPNLLFFFLINIPLIFCVLFTFVLPLHGASPHLQDPNFSAVFPDEKMENGLVEWKIERRIAAETSSSSSSSKKENISTSGVKVMVLAAERTHRKDPTNGFHYYTGGWNITSKNYIASVAYSAVVPFVLAGIWLLLFGIYLLLLCFRRCCCTKKHYGYSQTAYNISLTLLALFTLASIAGVVPVYIGQEKFQNSIIDTVSYVLSEANSVVRNLQDLLSYLRAAQNVGVGSVALPEEWKKQVDDKANTINALADKFRNVTSANRTQIKNFTNPLRTVLLWMASLMLVVAVSGLLFSIVGWQWVVYCLGILGWLLVAHALILAGIFILVHNVVADTRVAVDEWLVNPSANSALEDIIPKVDNQTASDISYVTKGVTYSLILVVNGVISNVSNADIPHDIGPPLYYNQSGPLVPRFCNPYDDNLNDAKCNEGEVNFNNASEVWKNYVCEVKPSGICTTKGRLTPKQYSQFTASANVSYGLQNGMPFVLELINTSYLQKIFGVISKKYCPKLESYTKMMYIAFFISSFGVMLSIIWWFVYGRQRRHRAYTRKIDKRSAEVQFA